MDIIELECPSCGEMLELDAGFAGGVCRCSDCGTLMTVPADPSRERAEALKRPDRPGRPDAPTSLRPARTDDDVEVEVEIEPEPATSQTAIELSASGALDDLSAATADIAAATTSATAAGTLGTETYFTPSGKEVRISRTMVIPTAKKRSSIRAIGISILIGGTAVLFALIVGLVYVLFGNSGGGNVPTRPQVVGLSPDENPLTSEKINFLGMPLRKSTAIVIESYYYNKYWSEPVTAALESVIDKAGTTNTFQVILSTDLGPKPYPPNGTIYFGQLQKQEVTELLRQTASLGAGSPIKAIKAAIDGHAEQIILVGGQRLDPQDLGELKELIKGASHLKRFDVVLIDENAAEMSDVADRYISLPLDKLRVWYAAWQQQKQQQKSPGGN